MPRLVALDMPWDNAFVSAMLAAWDAGDAVAPLDPRLPPPAAKALVEALRPTHVAGPDGVLVSLEGGLPTEPGDALVVATSGTSGSPKAVVLTREAVVRSAEVTSGRLGVDPRKDKWLACLPLSHVGGLGVVTRAVVTGTPLVVHRRFDAGAVVREAEFGVTLVSLVATALSRVDSALFRKVLLGGAAPPQVTASNIVTTYGMTETCGGAVYDGVPLDDVEVAVSDDDGGTPAEILLRGPMLLRAYRDGSDPRVPGGWLPTGDAGTIDDQGRLAVFGRIADTINTGGEKVWPESVEKVLSEHPSIADVAVAARPDPEWGQRVVAFVVPTDAAEPPRLEDIREFVLERLAPWAAPASSCLSVPCLELLRGKWRAASSRSCLRRD